MGKRVRAVAAEGSDSERADGVRALESAVWLWAALLGRRTTRGWCGVRPACDVM